LKYDNQNILLGLSGGINSMAVLCWLIEQNCKPKSLHLFYAHFREHSPDTFQFVADGIRYARKHFNTVFVQITKNSVLQFFRDQKMIPHPLASPCTRILKIEPMMVYAFNNGIQVDLIGYVRRELKKRGTDTAANGNNLFFTKEFPIGLYDDEWCFEIVDKHIGWHPAIYDIRDETGKRIFTHNNCLPCKNFTVKQMKQLRTHYPANMVAAQQLSSELKSYWGRNSQDYYTEFGKEDYEAQQCEVCAFD
jgi:hypothetical protein